jgi:hypothetical protein
VTQSRASIRLPSVTIHLTAVEKQRFASLAASRGRSESQLGLEAIRLLLGSHGLGGASDPLPVARESSSDRLTIRLRPGDRHLIAERANRRGVKASTYITAMVRAHLRANPPLTGDELATFKQAVIVLAGIGRALVLRARSGVQSGNSDMDLREDLSRLRGTVTVLEQRMREFVKAALISWESPNG